MAKERINITISPEVAATLQWMSGELKVSASTLLESGVLALIEIGTRQENPGEAAFFERARDFLKSQYGPPEPLAFVQENLFGEPIDD